MQKALNYLYKLFIFNGIISTISIMYMQLCVSFGTQIKLKMQGSDVNYGLSLTLFIAMFMISILSWLVIYYFRNRLETPEIREKINALYQDTDLKRKKLWKLAYFPLFLLRKILLVASSFSALFVNFQI